MNTAVAFHKPQIVIEGTALNTGIAQGFAYIYDPHFLDKKNLTIEQRKEIFERVVLDALKQCPSSENLDKQSYEFIMVQKALLTDATWHRRVFTYLDQNASLNDALENVLKDLEKMFSVEGDSFWHTRFLEIRGVTQLVRQCLSAQKPIFDPKKPLVICAKNLSPIEIMQFHNANIVALVVEQNSFLSHSMILARSKRIPVIGGLPNFNDLIQHDDDLLIDGDLGRIYVRPPSTIVQSYEHKQQNQDLNRLDVQNTLVSRDGIPIHLYLNANVLEDADYLDNPLFNGIGLYRTEIAFMTHNRWLDTATQTNIYKTVLNKAKNKPVIFRTLDIGGDKSVQFFPKRKNSHSSAWNNRFVLQHPALIRLQLRALIRAHAQSNFPDMPLQIMFPMISEMHELHFMMSLVEKELEREKQLGHRVPYAIRIGVMIEVPSLVFQLNTLLDYVDFISIGSNDLFQFFYAIDRTDASMSLRYDFLSYAFLQMLRTIINQAHEKGVSISLCGEMASNPIEVMALLGIGLRHLSINPNALNSLEKMIKSLDVWSMQDCMNDCLNDHPFFYKIAEKPIRQRVLELATIQHTDFTNPKI